MQPTRKQGGSIAINLNLFFKMVNFAAECRLTHIAVKVFYRSQRWPGKSERVDK